MSGENTSKITPGKDILKAPSIRLDKDTLISGLSFGGTMSRGAAVMIELIFEERLIGYMCTSLLGEQEVREYQIAWPELQSDAR